MRKSEKLKQLASGATQLTVKRLTALACGAFCDRFEIALPTTFQGAHGLCTAKDPQAYTWVAPDDTTYRNRLHRGAPALPCSSRGRLCLARF